METASAFPAVAPTPEADWIHLVGQAPELARSARPVVVVAPHPDDETLAVGGLLHELAARAVDITVVTVTDGEASHPALADLGAVRATEQADALAALGLASETIGLHLPDGGVEGHRDQLVDALAAHCDRDTVLLAPWERDGHTDHDASGRAAREAAERTGARLYAFPVWAWQWAALDDLAGLPLRRITLTESARAAKADAIACYSSQLTAHDGVEAIVGIDALARFLRPWEVVIDVG